MKIRKTFAVVSAAMMLSAGVTFLTGSAAQAAGCSNNVGCGSVNNNSRFKMTTTETWDSGKNWCRQWQVSTTSLHKCTQNDLEPGGLRGGGNVDVDAVTYNNTDWYYLDNRITKGVWVRLAGGGHMYCKAALSEALPRCS
ncbi:hypothetical protein Q0Z83_054830 [Actinoplanes sichuanensis]|uniref:Secreted protein n=1 Tax=Actinoplanes sichuanensis TaxID=512349 RepID=A0ABW4ASX9_9ACTN|nr:hypothetical protein [Actinoplanes sichuanensis]BEL07292.1 hypothetical protein Q0Z83_054830 [Actinoplanes sichuanensis]